ncbi:MAG TPA: glycosyltransferase 87 family protein [Thermoleophilaceae bacterium]
MAVLALILVLALPALASAGRPPVKLSPSQKRMLALAEARPTIKELHRQQPQLHSKPPSWDGKRWLVDYYGGGKLQGEVVITRTYHVVGAWTGLQARASFTRGHIGGLLDSPWVIIVFSLLFLAPFVDPRRAFRLLHLDLLLLVSFGISYWCLRDGAVKASIFLFYAVLLYLLGRMLWAGFRPATRPRRRLVPHAPTTLLVIGVLALTGARIGLNIANHSTFDIAYASVVGADRIWHKQELYTGSKNNFDTYGPLTYAAYVPLERIFPWKQTWDYLPAAHAAAIAFDLLTLLGLFLLGRQLRAGPEGRRLGLALAWAWAAFPFTLYGLMESTNDGLIAMLLVYSLVMFFSPAGRGALIGAAAAAKFFPGALLPLLAAGRGERDRKRFLTCMAAGIGIFVFAIALYLPPDGGLRQFWDSTLGYQLSRSPDFSLWAIYSGLGWTKVVADVLGLGLALVVALVPRRRSLVQAAALGAAVTIALELPAGHWWYFYIVWFMPLLLVALFAPYAQGNVAEPLDAGSLHEQIDLLGVARAREEDQLVAP